MCPAPWQAELLPMMVLGYPGCPIRRQLFHRVHPLLRGSVNVIAPLEEPDAQSNEPVGSVGPAKAPVEIWDDNPYPHCFFALDQPF